MPFLTPPPDPNPRAPRQRAPAGSVDCHIHLFGPKEKYAFDPGSPYISEDALLDPNATVVLDHFASIPAEQGVTQPAMRALLEMLETGRVWVKISGPMRCCPGDYSYAPVTPIARHLAKHAPDRLVWATDWPHTNMAGRKMPNDGDLFDLLTEWVEDETIRRRILVDNPAVLYGFGKP